MALTATATPRVAEDILKILQLPKARCFKSSFFRSNLFFSVYPKPGSEKDEQGRCANLGLLLDYIRQRGGVPGGFYMKSGSNAGSKTPCLRPRGSASSVSEAPASHAGKPKPVFFGTAADLMRQECGGGAASTLHISDRTPVMSAMLCASNDASHIVRPHSASMGAPADTGGGGGSGGISARGFSTPISSTHYPTVAGTIRADGSFPLTSPAPAYLGACPQSGIVYCLSRKESEEVAKFLREEGGLTCMPYHAGLSAKERMEIQNLWRVGKIQVVVATIAFGMGIDKSDVRFVAHFCISKSLEGYFQEAGRAGRDGQLSECAVFYSTRDTQRIAFLLGQGRRRSSTMKRELDLLDQVKQFCSEDGQGVCRHRRLLEYFGESKPRGQDGSEWACGQWCDLCARSAAQKDRNSSTARHSHHVDGPHVPHCAGRVSSLTQLPATGGGDASHTHAPPSAIGISIVPWDRPLELQEWLERQKHEEHVKKNKEKYMKQCRKEFECRKALALKNGQSFGTEAWADDDSGGGDDLEMLDYGEGDEDRYGLDSGKTTGRRSSLGKSRGGATNRSLNLDPGSNALSSPIGQTPAKVGAGFMTAAMFAVENPDLSASTSRGRGKRGGGSSARKGVTAARSAIDSAPTGWQVAVGGKALEIGKVAETPLTPTSVMFSSSPAVGPAAKTTALSSLGKWSPSLQEAWDGSTVRSCLPGRVPRGLGEVSTVASGQPGYKGSSQSQLLHLTTVETPLSLSKTFDLKPAAALRGTGPFPLSGGGGGGSAAVAKITNFFTVSKDNAPQSSARITPPVTPSSKLPSNKATSTEKTWQARSDVACLPNSQTPVRQSLGPKCRSGQSRVSGSRSSKRFEAPEALILDPAAPIVDSAVGRKRSMQLLHAGEVKRKASSREAMAERVAVARGSSWARTSLSDSSDGDDCSIEIDGDVDVLSE